MNKNKGVLIALILQVLNEKELNHGSYSKFAEVFASFSKKKCSRQSVSSWIQIGVPPKQLGFLESLSRIHAKNESSVITAKKLRPDLFQSEISNPEYLHGIVTMNFAGITFTGDNLMLKLFLSAVATINLAPTTINGVVKPVENVTYRSNDESILVVDEFGNVSAVGIGKATIHITADAQIGDGTTTLTESIEIEVTPEQAVALNPTLELHSIPAVDSVGDGLTSGVSENATRASEETPAPAPLSSEPASDLNPTISQTPEPVPTPEPTTEQPAEQPQEVAA